MLADSRARRLALSYFKPEVFYSLAWRGSMAAAGLISIYFIGHRLTPVEQGFWYSFDSLAVARAVFELGFSMVLMQVASHEYPSLHWEDGLLQGSPVAKARLSAVLRRSVSWYGAVAVLTLAVCLVVGNRLFTGAPGGVNWRLPWYSAILLICGLVALTPLGAILEGTGKLAAVARMRLVDSVVSNACVWIALSSGKHLFAMTAGLAASFCIQAVWFGFHWRFYADLWKSFLPSARDFWRKHVWPFQKRIAVSFVSGYFIITILNPLSFAVIGPAAAGRFGMTLTLAQGIISLSTAVVKASSPRFGELIHLRRWADLDGSFRLSLVQSLTISVSLAVLIEAGVIYLGITGRPMAARILGPWAAGFVMLAAVIGCITQALAIYVRAHKTEPLLAASITVAALSVPVNYLLLKGLGAPGAAFGFLALNGFASGVWTYLVFRKYRRAHSAETYEYAAL